MAGGGWRGLPLLFTPANRRSVALPSTWANFLWVRKKEQQLLFVRCLQRKFPDILPSAKGSSKRLQSDCLAPSPSLCPGSHLLKEAGFPRPPGLGRR